MTAVNNVPNILSKLRSWAINLAIIVGVALLIGFSIGTIVSVPPYALVMADDDKRTFFAPQCVHEWQSRPSKTFGILRRTTIADVERLKYSPDHDCKETGAFSEDGPSASTLLLIRLGLWPKQKYWWDMPYRTEHGVVHPGDNTPN